MQVITSPDNIWYKAINVLPDCAVIGTGSQEHHKIWYDFIRGVILCGYIEVARIGYVCGRADAYYVFYFDAWNRMAEPDRVYVTVLTMV